MHSDKIKYVIVGGINTAAGYLIGILVYKFLFEQFGIWLVGLVSNILSISFSFVTYKQLVFKTSGNWVREYFRCYVTYGALALAGMFLLWMFVQRLNLTIWVAQGLIITCTMLLSYIGHKRYTFR